MTNLSSWNPWRQMLRRDPLARLGPLEEFEVRFPQWPAVQDMRVDVNDTGATYVLKADLPGVRKEDIDIAIDGNCVSIAADVKRDFEDKDERRVCSERFFGHVERSFTLDSAIDPARAEAKYDGGVLQLTLPKKAGAEARRVTVA